MKHTLVQEPLTEVEVHPPAAFDGLVRACVDAFRSSLDRPDAFRVLTRCPACASDDLETAFDKHGCSYRLCRSCRSLFATPRPTEATLDWYLKRSPAAELRRAPDFVAVMADRRRDVTDYRATWVGDLAARCEADGVLALVGPRLPEMADQLDDQNVGEVVLVNPLPPCDDPAALAGRRVVDRLADLPPGSCRVVMLFEFMEHAADPAALLAAAAAALAPGGRLVLTTRSGSGFDIQVLWEHANVFPMDHLNLLSVEGVTGLLDRTGFEILEMSTPGLLDLQTIQRVHREGSGIKLPRFLEYLLARDDADTLSHLQTFLQESLLSSHLRVVAAKPAPR